MSRATLHINVYSICCARVKGVDHGELDPRSGEGSATEDDAAPSVSGSS
jgi:hypothetical protein